MAPALFNVPPGLWIKGVELCLYLALLRKKELVALRGQVGLREGSARVQRVYPLTTRIMAFSA
jgi:hypothetical protein